MEQRNSCFWFWLFQFFIVDVSLQDHITKYILLVDIDSTNNHEKNQTLLNNTDGNHQYEQTVQETQDIDNGYVYGCPKI